MENEKCCSTGGHKIVGVFLVIALICLAVFLVSEARNSIKDHDYIGKSAEVPNTISIAGEGSVFAVPDVAKVRIGLNTEAKTAALAQEENTKKMNDVIDAIKAQGVEDKDIKTTNYNVNPKYNWDRGKNTLVGYTVNQNVTVKVRNTDKSSEILRVATEKGANQVGGLTFEIDDEETLKQEAREKAIANAGEKAKVLADQLNVKLGKVISFSESGNGYGYVIPKMAYGMGGEMALDEAAVAPQIQVGENEIKINVNLVYEIL